MAKKTQPSEPGKVNIYARIDAPLWRRLQSLANNSADPVHQGRSASQMVEMAVRAYLEQVEKRTGK